MMKRIAILAVALLACVCLAGGAMAGQTFKLASSLAITGPTSDAGVPYSQGMDDYIKYVNEEKILGDNKVEIDIRDDQYQNEITKRNFEEFLDEGIVLYLNYSTGSTLALKKDFEEVKIAVIPASFHAGNLEGSNYIFLPILSYSNQVIALSEYVANNHKGEGKAKVAMYIHPSAFGRGPVEDAKKAVEAGLNLDIVEVVEHGKDLDTTATLKRLLDGGVQYVITHSVQSPIATLLKDAERLGIIAKSFGEKGKITFLGAHYTGGNDLIALSGSAAEGFLWTTGYGITSNPGAGTDFQLMMGKRYGRDEKTANSHNYANGMMVTQVAVECIRRALEHGKAVTKEALYEELLNMNGANAYDPKTTVGPVTYSKTDKEGVDQLQIYKVTSGVFKSEGKPFAPKYAVKKQ